MNCCENPVFIGCFGHCASISTGLSVTQNGAHRIEVWTMGTRTDYLYNLSIGNTITFPNDFNEYMVHQFRVKQPDGSYMADGVTGSTCFAWRNVIQFDDVIPPV